MSGCDLKGRVKLRALWFCGIWVMKSGFVLGVHDALIGCRILSRSAFDSCCFGSDSLICDRLVGILGFGAVI